MLHKTGSDIALLFLKESQTCYSAEPLGSVQDCVNEEQTNDVARINQVSPIINDERTLKRLSRGAVVKTFIHSSSRVARREFHSRKSTSKDLNITVRSPSNRAIDKHHRQLLKSTPRQPILTTGRNQSVDRSVQVKHLSRSLSPPTFGIGSTISPAPLEPHPRSRSFLDNQRTNGTFSWTP